MSTVCSEVYDEVRKLAPHMQGQPLQVRVNPDVARALTGVEAEILKNLSGLVRSNVQVKADPQLHHEQFDVVPI